jgi:hypothetical protein
MFSEPTIQGTHNLSSISGPEGELIGAAILVLGVACYLARVAWIAMAYSSRVESECPQTSYVERTPR